MKNYKSRSGRLIGKFASLLTGRRSYKQAILRVGMKDETRHTANRYRGVHQAWGKGNRARRRQGLPVETPWGQHLKRWTMPDSYFGAEWRDYYVFLGRNRDSDCLDNSNFHCALNQIGGEVYDEETDDPIVTIVRESHWACGWVEWIAIHCDARTQLTKAAAIKLQLDDYPVLDDEDYSERESAEAEQVWKDCYNETERVAYIRDNRSEFEFSCWPDLRSCVLGEYFGGCSSELLH